MHWHATATRTGTRECAPVARRTAAYRGRAASGQGGARWRCPARSRTSRRSHRGHGRPRCCSRQLSSPIDGCGRTRCRCRRQHWARWGRGRQGAIDRTVSVCVSTCGGSELGTDLLRVGVAQGTRGLAVRGAGVRATLPGPQPIQPGLLGAGNPNTCQSDLLIALNEDEPMMQRAPHLRRSQASNTAQGLQGTSAAAQLLQPALAGCWARSPSRSPTLPRAWGKLVRGSIRWPGPGQPPPAGCD